MGLGTDISFLYKMVQLALCVRHSPLPHPDIFITLRPLPEARYLTAQIRVLFSLGNLRFIKKNNGICFHLQEPFLFPSSKGKVHISTWDFYEIAHTDSTGREKKIKRLREL